MASSAATLWHKRSPLLSGQLVLWAMSWATICTYLTVMLWWWEVPACQGDALGQRDAPSNEFWLRLIAASLGIHLEAAS